MGKSGLWRYSRARFTETPMLPYATAIGQATLAWNDLHECLGRLFGVLMGDPALHQSAAVWQSSQVDRSKRKMLDAAVKSIVFDDKAEHIPLDFEWMLGRVDALEDTRNNLVHAPLHLVTSGSTFTEGVKPQHYIRDSQVAVHDWGKNPRARNLATKDLLAEYRWCREMAVSLRDYALDLEDALASKEATWPDRPKLPIRKPTKTRQTGRQSGKAVRRPPLRSSPE